MRQCEVAKYPVYKGLHPINLKTQNKTSPQKPRFAKRFMTLPVWTPPTPPVGSNILLRSYNPYHLLASTRLVGHSTHILMIDYRCFFDDPPELS
jgi:hypothetical protein